MLRPALTRAAARFAVLLTLAAPVAVRAQPTAETPIRAGQAPVARTLSGEARHVFTLDVPARTFVSGAVVQETVDAVVEVMGPDGVRVASFDGPARGPETFTFTAATAGRYRIVVHAFEGATGRVTVAVDRAEPVATTPAGRADQAFAAVARPDVPATVVRLSQGGRVVYERAWGAADLALGVPATTETRVNIASVSKQFTAFALASLAADGRLSLGDSLRRWVPEMPVVTPAEGGPVTLRHLLTHTSGLREILNARLLTGWNLGDRLGEGAALALARRQPSPQNPPGAAFNYNNTGYMLAALAAERATATPFPEWMQAHVFAPLGMAHTSVVTETRAGRAGCRAGLRDGQDRLRRRLGDRPRRGRDGHRDDRRRPRPLARQHGHRARRRRRPSGDADARAHDRRRHARLRPRPLRRARPRAAARRARRRRGRIVGVHRRAIPTSMSTSSSSPASPDTRPKHRRTRS